jgi:hypothetical protein
MVANLKTLRRMFVIVTKYLMSKNFLGIAVFLFTVFKEERGCDSACENSFATATGVIFSTFFYLVGYSVNAYVNALSK